MVGKLSAAFNAVDLAALKAVQRVDKASGLSERRAKRMTGGWDEAETSAFLSAGGLAEVDKLAAEAERAAKDTESTMGEFDRLWAQAEQTSAMDKCRETAIESTDGLDYTSNERLKTTVEVAAEAWEAAAEAAEKHAGAWEAAAEAAWKVAATTSIGIYTAELAVRHAERVKKVVAKSEQKTWEARVKLERGREKTMKKWAKSDLANAVENAGRASGSASRVRGYAAFARWAADHVRGIHDNHIVDDKQRPAEPDGPQD